MHRLLRRGADLIVGIASTAASRSWLEAATPTGDIYFLNAMADLVSDKDGLHAMGPHVYRAGNRFVILRYATAAELAALEAAPRQAVFYVIDDDLEELSRTIELPAGYRRRLATFVAQSLPRILRMSDVVMAPNELLLGRFAGHCTELIRPSFCSVCDDFSHFDDPSRVRLVFTGTRSHLADLDAIANALERLCDAYPQAELTTFLGRWVPAGLRSRRNVVSRAPLGWPAYRKLLATARFHIALAPFRPVAVNQCRSHNKIHDHAALGAAGVYGDIVPYRRTISPGRDGLVLPSQPDVWLEQLSRLMDNPAEVRRLAENGAGLSRRIGSPAELRAFWCERFGLPPTAVVAGAAEEN